MDSVDDALEQEIDSRVNIRRQVKETAPVQVTHPMGRNGGVMVQARRMLWLSPMLAALVISLVAAAEKPAALQICVQFPAGVALFASSAQDQRRAVSEGTWMLDFDFTINGHAPTRITKSGTDCFRAWLPAQKVRKVAFDFSRLSFNLMNQVRPLELQLKADLWSDGGKFVIEHAPWSSAQNKTTGALTLKRNGVVMTDWEKLPAGKYTLEFTPKALPKVECPVMLSVVGVGTVRADRNPALFRERTEQYRKELLPSVIKNQKLQCDPAEAAQVTVQLHDGVFRRPLEPEISRVRVEEKEVKYQAGLDGHIHPFTQGLQLEIGPGQVLVFSEPTLQATR